MHVLLRHKTVEAERSDTFLPHHEGQGLHLYNKIWVNRRKAQQIYLIIVLSDMETFRMRTQGKMCVLGLDSMKQQQWCTNVIGQKKMWSDSKRLSGETQQGPSVRILGLFIVGVLPSRYGAGSFSGMRFYHPLSNKKSQRISLWLASYTKVGD